jgi:hypothetical protein
MASFASIIGLLLQLMLVVIVARLIFVWWQRRNMPASAYAAATGHSFGGLGGMLGGTNATPAGEPLTIAKSERVRTIARRHPRSLFGGRSFGPAREGHARDAVLFLRVKLLQGDLAEAWREGDTDCATVAMKFARKDSMVESASGRTVEGGERSEATELWTFMRARRQLAALCHPADLMDENSSAGPANGIRRVVAALRQSDLARR